MTKPKGVVYTCITGGYDNIPVHKYIDANWDYVLFTDNPRLIKAGHFAHWTVKPLPFDKLDNVKNSRWPKVNAHRIFPEYEYSLYVDGNIIINNKNIFDLADKLIRQNVLFALPNHPERTCIYDEAEIVKALHIELPKTVDAEMAFLRREKYPAKNGLSENNILLRKHNEIKPTLDLWWSMVEKYSKRDQLSLMYAMWKTGIKRTPIYIDKNGFGIHRKSDDFTFVFLKTHNQNKILPPTHKIRKFVVRLIGCFIPIAKYRRQFKQKFIK